VYAHFANGKGRGVKPVVLGESIPAKHGAKTRQNGLGSLKMKIVRAG
jgi:hypothetical protein